MVPILVNLMLISLFKVVATKANSEHLGEEPSGVAEMLLTKI